MPFPALAALSIGAKLKKVLPYAAVAVAVALVLTLAYCQGRSAGKNAVVVEQLEEDIHQLEVVGEANEGAATDRVNDAGQLAEQREELNDARTHQGDDAATRRARSLCSKLRQQGGDPSNHAACRGLEGAAGTAPAAGGVPD